MTRLTEEMIIARSKQSDLDLIKKLNCWGSDLTDVTVLQKLRGVEVLALSVNKISTLKPFEGCVKLQELYLRRNNISDINEIEHLQNLPNLRFLWLDENPCCEALGKLYRPLVLRSLPQLKKLDNVDVTQEEMDEALRGNLSGSVSPDPQQQEEEAYEDAYSSQPQKPVQPSQPQQAQARQPQQQAQQQQMQSRPQTPPQYQQGTQYARGSPPTPPREEYYQGERPAYPSHYRHSQNDLTDWDEQAHPHSQNGQFGSQANLNPNIRRSHEVHDRYAYRNGNARENSSEWDDTRSRRSEMRYPDATLHNTYGNYHRRPVNRSSNLLSATLCLVKELDYNSLEVVEHAIRCRFNDLSNE